MINDARIGKSRHSPTTGKLQNSTGVHSNKRTNNKTGKQVSEESIVWEDADGSGNIELERVVGSVIRHGGGSPIMG